MDDTDRPCVLPRGELHAFEHAAPGDALDVGLGQRTPEGRRARFERGAHVGADHDAHGEAEGLRVDLRPRFLDGVAERLAELRRCPCRIRALRIYRMVVERRRGERDAQPSGRAADFRQERPRRRRRPVRVSDVRAGGRIEQRRAVAHRPRHRVSDRGAAPAFARIGPQRVARARRLHAEESAAGGRDADRAAAVRRVGHGHDAAGDRGGGATTRSAGAVGKIPRVLRRAEAFRLRRGRQAHLGRVGLAEDDETGTLHARGDLAVVIGDVAVEERAAVARGGAGVEGAEILQEVRHARERSRRQPGRDGGARLVVEPGDDRVQRRVGGLGARDGRLQQLRRGDFLAAHEIGEAQPVVLRDVDRGHWPSLEDAGILAHARAAGRDAEVTGRCYHVAP